MSHIRKLSIAAESVANDDPFIAYRNLTRINAEIAALTKQQKALKTILEDSYRAGQKRIKSDDQAFCLVRKENVRQGYTVEGFTFYTYSVEPA